MTEQVNLRQAEVFRVVLQFGSMTKAAEVLGISQPAVSRLMTAMAESAGFALFRRENGALVPTQDAALLAEELERAQIGLSLIQDRIAAIRDGLEGRVRVVAMAHFANGLLPECLAAFLAAHPKYQVDLDVQPRARIAEQITQRRADLGVVSLPVQSAGLHVTPLLSGDAVAILPARSALSALPRLRIADLDGVPFIGFAQATPLRYEIDALIAAAGVRPRIVMEVTTHEAVCKLVAAGAGVAIVGPFSDWMHSDPRVALRPLDARLPIEIGLLSAAEGMSTAAAKLHAHIQTWFAKGAAALIAPP